MPLYEYLCDACGHQFELIRKFSDPPLKKCPVCRGAVHKLQSAPAIQFKGSGFYITDYAKKEHVAAAKADADASKGGSTTKDTKDTKGSESKKKTSREASGKSESKSETKTDTKTDTKSETKTESKAAPST